MDDARSGGCGTPLLAIKAVNRSFGGIHAVVDVDLEVRSGEIVGLVGSNGAGKTTLFNLITGIIHPSSGDVMLNGRNIARWSTHRIARSRVGRTFQIPKLFEDMTVLENLLAALHFGSQRLRSFVQARKVALEVCESVGLTSVRGTRAGDLNLGQKKLLELGRALAVSPRLLLVDEPMAGLRRDETDRLVGMLRSLVGQQDLGMLVVEHSVRIVRDLADRVVVMDRGQIIARGSPDDVADDPVVIEAYLGRRYAKRSTGHASA